VLVDQGRIAKHGADCQAGWRRRGTERQRERDRDRERAREWMSRNDDPGRIYLRMVGQCWW
jgi:hypothetical protein